LLANYFGLNAQILTPQPSPRAQVIQKVGLTTVEIDYSRPAVRGRKIMGNLVRYDEIWRTGANKNTIISFSDPVQIEGNTLPAGQYGLYTRPSSNQWKVYFYKSTNYWGLPNPWDESEVALSLIITPSFFEYKIENFTISISDINSDAAQLNLIWENTLLSIPFEVPTKAKAMESINETMAGNPKPNDYYNAALYFLQENMDLNQAKNWMEIAIAKRDTPAFWMYYRYALILLELNDNKGALTASKKSLALAEKAENKDYVILNKELIEKWSR
jgi:tetratricopeptide (TPR) repeat protein